MCEDRFEKLDSVEDTLNCALWRGCTHYYSREMMSCRIILGSQVARSEYQYVLVAVTELNLQVQDLGVHSDDAVRAVAITDQIKTVSMESAKHSTFNKEFLETGKPTVRMTSATLLQYM